MTADRAFNRHGTNFEGSPEPIYGPLFLPRKFKVGVTGEPSGGTGHGHCLCSSGCACAWRPPGWRVAWPGRTG